MVKMLVAKPAVRRVNRVISIPKAVHPASLRPSKGVNKAIKQAQRYKKPTPSHLKQATVRQRVRQAIPANAPIAQAKSSRLTAQRRQIIKNLKRSPVIRYRNNEIDEASKQKINNIKDQGKGKLLVIIGNGPSILEADLPRLAHHPLVDIMSINKPDDRIWPTKYWLFCDNSQFKRHEVLWKKYEGTIFNTTAIKNRQSGTIIIRNIGGMGFSKDLSAGFHIGRSSVYASMQVALWLGYEHIYIFGCDMSSAIINGQELVHFYGVNPDVQPKNRKGRFDHEAKHYDDAARTLKSEIRKKYTFCSSFLKYKFANKFNKMGHKEAVSHILKHASKLEDSDGE